jgi:hypothetical protein
MPTEPLSRDEWGQPVRPEIYRPLLMKAPRVQKKVIRWLQSGLKQFWYIRCPTCRQFTRQRIAGYTTTGGQIRRCVPCGRVFSRKESRDAQKAKGRR